MKGAAKRIIPNETHVIKATAWDALYAAYQLSNNRPDSLPAAFLKTMDTLLNQVGEKYSNAKTWGAIMPKKFSHETMYRCTACGSATLKTDWTYYKDGLFKCPNCGCIQDLTITNENPPEVPRAPEQEKPEKQSAKK